MPQPTVTLTQIHRALSASGWRDVSPEAFDQWLAQRDTETAAKAHEKAVAMCCEFLGVPNVNWPNPHQTETETEDDQTVSASRVPVEVPGADSAHRAASVLNAAIDVHQVHLDLQRDGGTLTSSARAYKAQDALHAAVRDYLPLVTS